MSGIGFAIMTASLLFMGGVLVIGLIAMAVEKVTKE
jgi:hypothetical protein